jgi:hypothetical protein
MWGGNYAKRAAVFDKGFVETAKFVIMKVKELNKSKLPVVRIDNSLEKYKNKVLFKDKLDKANEMLKTTGLPKSKKQHS